MNGMMMINIIITHIFFLTNEEFIYIFLNI